MVRAESRTVAARRRLSFGGVVSVALALNEKGALLAQVDPRKITGVVFNAAEETPENGYYRYTAKASA